MAPDQRNRYDLSMAVLRLKNALAANDPELNRNDVKQVVTALDERLRAENTPSTRHTAASSEPV